MPDNCRKTFTARGERDASVIRRHAVSMKHAIAICVHVALTLTVTIKTTTIVTRDACLTMTVMQHSVYVHVCFMNDANNNRYV